MFDIRHLNLTYREQKNIRNPKAQEKELQEKALLTVWEAHCKDNQPDNVVVLDG
ncbi:MAG: hypothetical protein ABJZ62_00685 [Hyphomicrobiales bacterium]